MTQMATLDTGATLAFWQRDKDKALEDLKEIKPTIFPSVPRIFEKIYEQAAEKAERRHQGQDCSTRRSTSGARSASSSARARSPGPVLKKEYELADKQIFCEVRDLFGGELSFAVTGAAPVRRRCSSSSTPAAC